eukprot:656571-Rhodomonas_salina.2
MAQGPRMFIHILVPALARQYRTWRRPLVCQYRIWRRPHVCQYRTWRRALPAEGAAELVAVQYAEVCHAPAIAPYADSVPSLP